MMTPSSVCSSDPLAASGSAGTHSRREYIAGFDVLRIVAIALVVALHVLAVFRQPGASGLSGATRALTSVGVPLFFAISGYLAGRERDQVPDLARTAAKLLVPYAVWSLVYCFAAVALGLRSLSIGWIGSAVVYGQASWHLWFLPALFMCHVVWRWVQPSNDRVLAAVAISLPLLALRLSGLTEGLASTALGYTALGWASVFFLGAALARSRSVFESRSWHIPVAGASLAFIAVLGWLGLDGTLPWKPLVGILALSVCLLAVTVSAGTRFSRSRRVSELGNLVFGAYLVHMLPLDVVRASSLHRPDTPGVWLLLTWVSVLVFSFAVSWLMSRLGRTLPALTR